MEILAMITILYIFAFLIALIRIDHKVSKMEKKRREDMELIKGMLQELNKKTFEPPFDIKTPEKIYLATTKGVQNLDTSFVGIAHSDPQDIVEPIEYIRTDAFIEKALKFLDGCISDYIDLKHANVDTFMDVDNERFINDFINYIKGE